MIITTRPPYNTSTHDPVVIRALSSITSEQADIIAVIVQGSGQAWKTQTIDDYDGYLSLLIEPADVSIDEQKALFISGTAQHLELFEVQGDDLAFVGTFADIKQLETCLTELIELYAKD